MNKRIRKKHHDQDVRRFWDGKWAKPLFNTESLIRAGITLKSYTNKENL